jgi:histidine ammonia-lyase
MPNTVHLSKSLSWRQVAAIAEGAPLVLADPAESRIRRARLLVESIVTKGIRAYGVNTGVGALCDVIVEPSQLRHLSRNIVMSHAVGVGAPLGRCEVRAIIAAAVNNFAHGHSGVRLELVDRLLGHLRQDWIPEVPSLGSVGYLSHMAHIALALLGEGFVQRAGQRRATSDVLKAADIDGLVLEAKEGLSLVNGTPCVTGLMSVALMRSERLLNWADVIAAMSFENLRGQMAAFDAAGLRLRASPSLSAVGERISSLLDGSELIKSNAGRRTQDALSLRAVPQVHGAARDVFASASAAVDAELRAVTDNPMVMGTEDEPRAISQANAIGASIGLHADSLGVAMAELVAMSERRTDRLVNPLLSGLPAFLASDNGAGSGFMIAQYTAASLVADNRRLAAPASLDAGVTSGLQEDHLCHATPAALKLLKILDNAEFILSIELLAAVQAYDLQTGGHARAPNTDIVYRAVRERIPHYRDERPLGRDIERVRELIREPTAVDFEESAGEHREEPARARREEPRREEPRRERGGHQPAPRHQPTSSPQPQVAPKPVAMELDAQRDALRDAERDAVRDSSRTPERADETSPVAVEVASAAAASSDTGSSPARSATEGEAPIDIPEPSAVAHEERVALSSEDEGDDGATEEFAKFPIFGANSSADGTASASFEENVPKLEPIAPPSAQSAGDSAREIEESHQEVFETEAEAAFSDEEESNDEDTTEEFAKFPIFGANSSEDATTVAAEQSMPTAEPVAPADEKNDEEDALEATEESPEGGLESSADESTDAMSTKPAAKKRPRRRPKAKTARKSVAPTTPS